MCLIWDSSQWTEDDLANLKCSEIEIDVDRIFKLEEDRTWSLRDGAQSSVVLIPSLAIC